MCCTANAQLMPAEGRFLHYRIIGFTIPKDDVASGYTLEIAQGEYSNSDSFSKHIISTLTSKSNRIVAEVPAFGATYSWRMKGISGKNKKQEAAEIHHFSTLMIPEVDSTLYRLRIIKAAQKYKDGYVMAAGNKVMYDMKGKPVWFLPDLKGKDAPVFDMKLSQRSTLTCLFNNYPYEVNYEGMVLWLAPNDGKVSGDSIERYHHEFTKLSNNHYMVLGNAMNKAYLPANDSTPNIMFGTLIEYDQSGNVVWSWKSAPYFQHNDFRNFVPCNIPNPNVKVALDPHENGFYFDEKNKVIYLSCKNISRIIKISYPGGKIINAYGEQFKEGHLAEDHYLFSQQHNPGKSSDGYFMIFNNGTYNFKPGIPKIMLLAENKPTKNNMQTVWEFDFGKECGFSQKYSGGGNMKELPDRSFFVSTGQAFGEFFIIDRNKKILWRAAHEKKNLEKNNWEPVSNYRAEMILSKKELEKLIWSTLEHKKDYSSKKNTRK
jgi:hypothetical protein